MKELLFHKRKLGYTQSTKRSPLEFQPEWAQGKAWIWSGCGDADVKRGSVLGRVEMWRGGFRLDLSVSASFVWRCLSSPAVTSVNTPTGSPKAVTRPRFP